MNIRGALQRAVAFLRRVVARTRNTGLARTAGSLAFTTVLGIVPMATVVDRFSPSDQQGFRVLRVDQALRLRNLGAEETADRAA